MEITTVWNLYSPVSKSVYRCAEETRTCAAHYHGHLKRSAHWARCTRTSHRYTLNAGNLLSKYCTVLLANHSQHWPLRSNRFAYSYCYVRAKVRTTYAWVKGSTVAVYFSEWSTGLHESVVHWLEQRLHESLTVHRLEQRLHESVFYRSKQLMHVSVVHRLQQQ